MLLNDKINDDLKRIVDGTYEYELRHLHEGTQKHRISNYIFTDSFGSLIKNINKALKVWGKCKKMGLEPNMIYPTNYDVYFKLNSNHSGNTAVPCANLAIKTDALGNVLFGFCPYYYSDGYSTRDYEFSPIKVEDINNDFFEYIQSKRNEFKAHKRVIELKKKISKL